MSRLYVAVVVVCLCGALTGASRQQNPRQERPPVFRAGAHFVRVDTYPTRDGRIVEGLTPDDFEVLEDGKPQAIDTFQFIRFDAFTTDEQRRDPNSQREAFALAGDPAYRVFVLYLDAYHVNLIGSHSLRQPLVNMLQRILGPRDLFGMLTPQQMPRDLILGRQTQMIEEQLANWTWGLQGRAEYSPEENALLACFGEDTPVIGQRRLDKVFSDLEELVALLGGLRQERKNILLFSRGWSLPGPAGVPASRYTGPPVGITDAGKLTLGAARPGDASTRWCMDEAMRLSGIDFRRRHRDLVTESRRQNVTFYPVNPSGLEAPGQIPTSQAERNAEDAKRRADPTYNSVAAQMDDIRDRNDGLIELATNTDGTAVINSNDLTPGLTRIANDLAAYYVLGYYTTNTKWDGGVRKITVRLKKTHEAVRARREYRAPTEAEMAGMREAVAAASEPKPSGPTPATALGELARLRPAATLLAHGASRPGEVVVAAELAAAAVEAGRWKAGGDVEVIVSGAGGGNAGAARGRIDAGARATLIHVPISGAGPWSASVRLRAAGEADQFDRISIPVATGLLGEPLAYRATPAPASPLRPVGAFQFRRTERIHIDWPVLRPLDRRDARLLGRDGKPLALEVNVGERPVEGQTMVAVDLNLAPLTAGDYVIELTAGAGADSDAKLLAIRIVR